MKRKKKKRAEPVPDIDISRVESLISLPADLPPGWSITEADMSAVRRLIDLPGLQSFGDLIALQ